MMLKVPEYYKIYSPAIVEVEGGVTIRIDAQNNVTIEGQRSIRFKTDSDIEFDAKNISMQAQENVYIGSGKHLVQQAPRIDLNPKRNKSGYKK
jgi:hypothetical protein